MRWLLLCAALALLSGVAWSEAGEATAARKTGEGGPLVVMLGGSEGGFLRAPKLSQAFMAQGIAVAQVAYFRFPNGTQHLQEIPIDAVAARIEALAQGHECVGVLGVSKGAELALLMAVHRPVADVTVAVVPSHVVWQSSRVSLRKTGSWTLDGRVLPFLPYRTVSLAALRAAMDYEDALPLHENALTDAVAARSAAIPVERVAQPVLLQSAAQDQIWPSALMARQIMERVGTGNRFTHLSYDHDHYLLAHPPAVTDLITYLRDHLSGC